MGRDLEEEIKRLNKKLEATLEIVLEYLRETEEKIEELEIIIEELKDGTTKDG
jgi:hypothetical protein